MLFGGAAILVLACASASGADIHSFDIPAGNAGSSIAELARQAGRQIVAPGEALRGVQTPAVHGAFDVETALTVLLRGTKLSIASDDGHTVILAVQPESTPASSVARSAETENRTFESVTVTGYRASLADSTNAKRSSTAFSDSIFAEDIGKFPDNNIAEAVNRVPGITISREIDGSGVNVSIRGLGSNFAKVLLNGAQVAVASTGPTNSSNANRELDLNMFPVELFTQLTVDKSPQADQLEGGAAGTINMRSVRPFDHPGIHVTYSLKAVDLAGQDAPSPNSALIVSGTDGPFGILVGVTSMATRFFTKGFESVGWTNPNLLTSGAVIQCSPAASCNMTGGGNWTIPTTVPANVTTAGLVPGQTIDQAKLLALNSGLTLTQIDNMLIPRLGRPFMEKGVRSRYNGVVSLEFRPTDGLHFFVDAIGARITNAFDRSDINWIVRNGQAIPIDVKVDRNGVVTAGTFANAQWFLEARPYHERGDFLGINPGAEWQATELLRLSFQANASRSHFFRDVPSIVVNTAPSAGNPALVPGPTPPAGGVYVTYSIPNGSATPRIASNVDLNNPASFQWAGGRVNAQSEKRYTFTNGLHFDVRYGDDEFNVKIGAAYDDAHREISGYDNSQAWQNAVCGDNPNVYVRAPNTQPPCQGLSVAGSASDVNAVASGYPTYPGLGTFAGAGYSALKYQGSLIPQSSLASYLKPGPAGFVNVDYGKFFRDSKYSAFDYPNAPAAISSNLGVGAGTIDEKNYGMYGEVNGVLEPGGRTLKYNVGLRWVQTRQTVIGPVQQGDPRNGSATPEDGGKYPNVVTLAMTSHTYRAFLPAINLVYEVTDDFQVRASLSRTMTRANPSSLLPGINFIDQSAATATLGNSTLKPYYSGNIDIGAEYYTGGEGYVGFGVFRKALTGFTTTGITTQPFSFLAAYGITYDTLNTTMQAAINARGGPGVATVQVSQTINASGLLTINGLEISCVQPLDFLLSRYGLSGLGIAANVTIVDQKGSGAAPAIATGISPVTYNLTGYYEDHGVSLHVSYVFDDRQVAAGTNQNGICLPSTASATCPAGAYLYNNAYSQLDLSSSLKLSTLFGELRSDPEIMFNVQNVLKSKLRSYFQYPEAVLAYYSPGTTYTFGIRGTF